MRHVAFKGLFAAAIAAGGAAQAAAPEARNPFHCSIAFQVSYELAKAAQGADSLLSRDLHSRMVWQAFAAAKFPKAGDPQAEADALRRVFTADPEAGMAMAAACMRRQDAHPSFREARLEKQVRDGFPLEPLSTRASLEQLKGVFQRSSGSASTHQE